MTRIKTHHETHSEVHHRGQKSHGSLVSYSIGFAISIVLTVIAFYVPVSAVVAVPLIIGAAIIQILVQLVFFLHIGKGPDKETYSLMLLFATIITFIVIGGTLWIMHNLASLHMHPATMEDLYEGGVMAPGNERK